MKILELIRLRPDWWTNAVSRHFLNRKDRERREHEHKMNAHRASLNDKRPWFDDQK